MDTVSKKKRSKIMSSIKSENTKPEKAIRSSLYGMGYRYRIHVRGLPGTPDIVFPKYGTVVFVNGCFWHRHDCDRATTPKTNKKFWNEKFENNKDRDKRNKTALEKMGWKVVVAWECELNENLQKVADGIAVVLEERKDNKIKLEKKNELRKKKKKTESNGGRGRRGNKGKRRRKGSGRG